MSWFHHRLKQTFPFSFPAINMNRKQLLYLPPLGCLSGEACPSSIFSQRPWLTTSTRKGFTNTTTRTEQRTLLSTNHSIEYTTTMYMKFEAVGMCGLAKSATRFHWFRISSCAGSDWAPKRGARLRRCIEIQLKTLISVSFLHSFFQTKKKTYHQHTNVQAGRVRSLR